jgi:hypothetical protein
MAKVFQVKVTGFEELQKKVERALNDTVKRTVMLDFARLARDIIYRRVKSGYGVSNLDAERPKQARLKPLSEQYKKYRSGLVEFATREGRLVKFKLKNKPKLGKFGAPSISNLTLTGQMLEAIEIEARRNGFQLFINDDVREDGLLTNAQLASRDYVQKERPFFALTDTEQRILFRDLERRLRQELQKVLGQRSVK